MADKTIRGKIAGGSVPQFRLKGIASALGAALVALVTGGFASSAGAGEFILDNGIEGQWSLNMSVGNSWRARSPDPALIMVGNGGLSGSSHDDGNLNYGKGDTFSTVAKLIGELQLKRDNLGAFFRVKGWYDYELEQRGVPHGHSANDYIPGAKLNDSDFYRLSKFSGIDLADAYVFANGTLGEGKPYAAKIGKYVVNWGESLFIPGINQYGAIDVAAARRPGAQVKEVLLSIPQLSASLGLSDALTLEGFYQVHWERNNLDGCGTYWSISDVYNCSNNGVVIGAGPFARFPDLLLANNPNGFTGLPPSVTNFRLANGGDRTPKNTGQYGIAARYFASDIGSEFGAYYVNYHQRSPIISVLFNSSAPNSIFSLGNNRLQYSWDWTAEDIKLFGLSFSTVVGGWSVFGEVSHTRDFPVQLNGLDLLRGAANAAGPLAFLQATPRNVDNYFHGYDLKNKTQLQVSTIKLFPRVAGAEQLSLVGEIGFQHWSGIGDPNTSHRYGRAFVFGQAATSTLSCAATGNLNPDFCENKGFATTNAWGYRLQAELSYPNVFAGANLRPRVFWSHDVKGYSADAIFLEDRRVLGLGARIDYLSRYYVDLSYNRYNRNAKYDVFHDRDFYSVVAGINF
jgi:hypothetical protein